MAWLQIHQTLRNHRKILAAADILNITPPHMIGLLISFWLWSLDNAPSGKLNGISPKIIARAAQWEDDPTQLVEAMKSTEWLDETADGIQIHDWYEYAGKLIDRRIEEKERSRKRRSLSSISDIRPPVDQQTTAGRPTNNLRQTRVDQTRVDQTRVDQSRLTQTILEIQDQKFSEFWHLYPKKIGKKSTLASWKRIKPDITLFNKIITTIEAAKRSKQWQRDEGQYIPNPTTWLNQGRWEDEFEEVNTNVVGNDRQHTEQHKEEPFSLSGFKSADDED